MSIPCAGRRQGQGARGGLGVGSPRCTRLAPSQVGAILALMFAISNWGDQQLSPIPSVPAALPECAPAVPESPWTRVGGMLLPGAEARRHKAKPLARDSDDEPSGPQGGGPCGRGVPRKSSLFFLEDAILAGRPATLGCGKATAPKATSPQHASLLLEKPANNAVDLTGMVPAGGSAAAECWAERRGVRAGQAGVASCHVTNRPRSRDSRRPPWRWQLRARPGGGSTVSCGRQYASSYGSSRVTELRRDACDLRLPPRLDDQGH